MRYSEMPRYLIVGETGRDFVAAAHAALAFYLVSLGIWVERH
jgi:hypothetical protein